MCNKERRTTEKTYVQTVKLFLKTKSSNYLKSLVLIIMVVKNIVFYKNKKGKKLLSVEDTK